jgi:hypothetical protein
MRLATALIWLLLAGCMSRAEAQLLAQGPSGPQVMEQLRNEYNKCVFSSVAQQVQSKGRGQDPGLVTEIAFQSCSTEEQGILTLLYSSGMQPSEANTLMVSVKLQLKRTIRDMKENPANYAPKHQ